MIKPSVLLGLLTIKFSLVQPLVSSWSLEKNIHLRISSLQVLLTALLQLKCLYFLLS